MLLLIDNYDSFTHTLAHLFESEGARVKIVRNDAISVENALNYRAVILSPGPSGPEQAGICMDLIKCAPDDLPILGICLGHQAIGAAFGARVGVTAPRHGRTSPVRHDGTGLFAGLPDPMTVARYHALMVDALPDCLHANAWSDDGVIMGLQHRQRPIFGLQFHPESVASSHGPDLAQAFLSRVFT